MAHRTEKLTLESAKQVRCWAVSAIEYSANTTSAYLWNWRSTMPWFFPPSSMVVRRGHCIAGISRNWSSSTCELSAPSWESGGRTTSPIWRSSIKLSPPSSRPNFDGLDTRFEWRSVGCQDAWCMRNFRPVKEIKVDQNCGIKTQSKPISSDATSIWETWRDMPWTDQNGKAWFTELLPTLKRFDAKNSLLPETDTAEQPRQWSQQLTFSAPTVQDCAFGQGLRSHLHVHRWVVEHKHHHQIRSDGQPPYIYIYIYTYIHTHTHINNLE